MLCDKCKQNPASVHMERIVNNVKTEYNLCFQCATGMDAEMSFDNIIKEFLGSIIELTKDYPLFQNEERMEPTCPVCGMSYGEFREEGRLGCAECYKAFRQQIDAVLKNIHGSSEHMGKVPERAAKEVMQKRELGTLRQKLKEAIEQEEFEAAAELRDRIRAVETEAGV